MPEERYLYCHYMESPDVKNLVQAAKNGDKQAFGQLYDTHASRIYRFIKIRLPQETQAEDALQDTFLKAWLALPKLKLENLNFSAWLYRIARNLVNDSYRKSYRTPAIEDISEHLELYIDTEIESNLDQVMMTEKVRTILPKLKTEYRQVIELRFIQEFSVAETSEILKRSQVAVRLLQYRALMRLRNLINENYVA